MTTATICAVVSLALASPALAGPALAGPEPPPGPIARAARAEALRLAPDPTTMRARDSIPPAKKHWVRRHPVATATLAGFGACFAIGWAMGDDGVFYDFTGEASGLMLGGLCAGGAASITGIVRAIRR
jgi:hypothetical protein